MVKTGAAVLGGVLALLWALGLAIDRHATILWFDAVLALVSFAVVLLEHEEEMGTTRAAAPGLIGVGLVAVGIGGLALGQPRWASWANLLMACAYLALAVASAGRARGVHLHMNVPALAHARVRVTDAIARRRGGARRRP
jgi:hypothetical protein